MTLTNMISERLRLEHDFHGRLEYLVRASGRRGAFALLPAPCRTEHVDYSLFLLLPQVENKIFRNFPVFPSPLGIDETRAPGHCANQIRLHP
jgi:hypothetical protein